MNDHLIKFKDLFQGDRQYIVPEYQRGYSWETPHREDLLGDIERVYESGKDYEHFTGTIVAAGNEDDEAFEIVDGQQRVTSLFMLCKLMSEYLDIQDLEDITREEHERLSLNTGTKRYFDKLLYDGTYGKPATKSQHNLKKAKEEFSTWIDSHQKILDEFADIILNKLGFLLYEPDRASKEMGIMFEVINNRGKPLSQLEKVKNYLTYYAQMVEDEIIEKKVIDNWPIILKNLSQAGINSNSDENSFLRYCWICFNSKNKQESYHVYENLKKRFKVGLHDKSQGDDLKQFIFFLVNCSEYYVDFFSKGEKKAVSPIFQLRHHPQYASIMPLYLAIREAFYQYSFNSLSKIELLDLLERANFRIYVCPDVTKRSDTHQGKFFGDARYLYKRIANNEKNEVEEELIDLKGRLKNRIQSKCDTKTFVQSLTLDNDEDYNYENWNGLKYFLANYENYLKEKEKVSLKKFFPPKEEKGDGADDTFSKEHLWATNNRAKKNDREKDKHQKKRLGNFVLLRKGINSRAGDVSIKEKIDIYSDDNRKSTLQMVINVKSYYKQAVDFVEEVRGRKNKTNEYYYELYKKLNDLNEEKMVNFALERWGLESEENHIVKIDSFENRDDEAVFQIYKN